MHGDSWKPRRRWPARSCSRYSCKGPLLTSIHDSLESRENERKRESTDHALRRDEDEYPVEGQLVRLHYEAFLPSGVKVESSRARGRPLQFKLGAGQVIRGWEYAIPQLTRGTRARFRVPADLAYGAAGRLPKIPPNSPLEFEVQLIDFYDPDGAWPAFTCRLADGHSTTMSLAVDLTPRDAFEDA